MKNTAIFALLAITVRAADTCKIMADCTGVEKVCTFTSVSTTIGTCSDGSTCGQSFGGIKVDCPGYTIPDDSVAEGGSCNTSSQCKKATDLKCMESSLTPGISVCGAHMLCGVEVGGMKFTCKTAAVRNFLSLTFAAVVLA